MNKFKPLMVENLHVAYGKADVLCGVSLDIQPGKNNLPARLKRRGQDNPHPRPGGADAAKVGQHPVCLAWTSPAWPRTK